MKKQTGRVNYVWVLAGGYLVYLAVKTLRVVASGESSAPMFTVPFAIAYALLGAWLLRREWKAYRYGVEHKDDPDSWADEGELPESADVADELPEATEEEEQP